MPRYDIDFALLRKQLHDETIRHHLDDESSDALLRAMTATPYQDGQIIFPPNDTNAALYLVARGVVRIFTYCGGKDTTTAFALPATVIARHNTLGLCQSPTGCAACGNDTVILSVPYSRFETTLNHYDQMGLWWIEILENQIYMLEKYHVWRSADATTRFLALMGGEWGVGFQSTILQAVPLSVIASYLGVTQSYLSILRSRWVKGELRDRK